MTIFPKGARKKAGLVPGTLVQTAEKKTEKTTITILDYDRESFRERVAAGPEECRAFRDTPAVTWINVEGLHELEVTRQMGEIFQIHPLVLEDILHTDQRPKMEDYEDYVYVVLKLLMYDEQKEGILADQISLILGKNFVLTFEEKERGILEQVRKRIREGRGRLRGRGADYLFYSLLDVIVDSYFVVLEHMGEDVEKLEEDVMNGPQPNVLRRIFDARTNMLVVRRAVWPLRDLTNILVREEIPLIGQEVDVYLRDVYDHAVQIIETVEVSRDMVQNMADMYLSVVNNRMNEVMKILTVIATIFIPLTFLASIYGMNFKHMPELEWPWAYFAVLGVMAALGFSMLGYFRWKKWF